MNKVLIFSIVCLIACSFIDLTTSLDCYVCDSTSGQNCNDKQSAQCDPELAQQTVNYARKYLYVNETILSTTSSTYICVFQAIQRKLNNPMKFYYGCSYSTIDICSYPPPGYSQYLICNLCNTNDCNNNNSNNYNYNGNYINNGNYSSTYSFTLTASIILALIAKLFCY